jgi:large subunit ribosomal protein L9
MKLILTSDVTGVGAPGDIIEVKDGFGRNYLVPRGLAIAWTKGGEKQVATIKRARKIREVADLGHAKEIKAQLDGLDVKLTARAGKGGRLFGSITSVDVVKAVRAAGGPDLDRRKVELAKAIKGTGKHDVHVRIHPDVETTLTLEVVSE